MLLSPPRLMSLLLLLAAVGLAERARGWPVKRTPTAAASRDAGPGASRAARLGVSAATPIRLQEWRTVPELPREIARFETVFWEAADTESLRQLIGNSDLVEGKRVLEIGTGTGLVALCCLQRGARRVVATDVNPAAIANAAYNAELLELDDRFELRLVPPRRSGAFQVIAARERFDLILSNPPWEDGLPEKVDDYAFYDQRFKLLHSLLAGLNDHLEPGGRALLAYGCVSAVRQVLRLAPRHGLRVRVLDERKLDDLPELFLPGMMLEVTPGRASRG